MRKRFCFILCILLLGTLLSACNEEASVYTANPDITYYNLGDKITLYDKVSHDTLGWISLTDMTVLKQGEIWVESIVEDQEPELYEGIVQISYAYFFNDSTRYLTPSNFDVSDHTGVHAPKSPITDYEPVETEDDNYFIVAVKNMDSYIDVEFSYRLYQESTATFRLYLDGTVPEDSGASNATESDEMRLRKIVVQLQTELEQKNTQLTQNQEQIQQLESEKVDIKHEMALICILEGFLILGAVFIIIDLRIKLREKKKPTKQENDQ